MTRKDSVQLYCFSPLVMLTTFLIETGAALYVLFRYRADMTARLIMATLGFLAFFQLAEYMVCQGAFLFSSLDWARMGYVAITILPPLGIHMGLRIAKKHNPTLLRTAYASALLFIGFFLLVGHGMQGQQCLGNYVIFTIAPYAIVPYTLYYYGWLVTGVMLAWREQYKVKNVKHRQALKWLAGGYLAFILPTIFANVVNPSTLYGIPSIMCGFAVLFALCLLFKVAPYVLEESSSKQGMLARFKIG